MTNSHPVFSNPALETLQKKSLKDEVFALLHHKIVAGKYSPGEWLRQEEIASQLGVSQTPVREGLDLLVSVGLAERVPYRGVRVPKPTHEEIVDTYIMRLVLESLAARLAARNASGEQLSNIRTLVLETKDLLTLDDMSTMHRQNRIIHKDIVIASGNFLLVKLYEMTSNHFPDWMLYEYMFRHPEYLESTLETEYQQHLNIVDSLIQHDPEGAVRQTIVHLRDLGRNLVNYLGISKELINEREKQIQPKKSAFPSN